MMGAWLSWHQFSGLGHFSFSLNFRKGLSTRSGKNVVQVLSIRREAVTITRTISHLCLPIWIATAPRTCQPIDTYTATQSCAKSLAFGRVQRPCTPKKHIRICGVTMSPSAEVRVRPSNRRLATSTQPIHRTG